MKLSIHEEPIFVADLCRDLKLHGAVFWHTTRPNFENVANEVAAAGTDAIPLCARPNGDFMNFLVMTHLVDGASLMEQRVAEAIIRWQALREPVPHLEPIR